jgi:hypothetical protein
MSEKEKFDGLETWGTTQREAEGRGREGMIDGVCWGRRQGSGRRPEDGRESQEEMRSRVTARSCDEKENLDRSLRTIKEEIEKERMEAGWVSGWQKWRWVQRCRCPS